MKDPEQGDFKPVYMDQGFPIEMNKYLVELETLKTENASLRQLIEQIKDVCTDYGVQGIEALKILQIINFYENRK
jgi:hypothetical protein